MAVAPPPPADDPWSADWPARVALALSILQHRGFCDCCAPHVEQAVRALNGASITEIAEGR